MAFDLESAQKRGWEAGKERIKLCVYEFYSGTGNHTEAFPITMRELCFKNDSAADIEVQIIGDNDLNITMVAKAREVFDERFAEFHTVVITGAGAWRFFPRTHLIP
jgi:hypothetical protein